MLCLLGKDFLSKFWKTDGLSSSKVRHWRILMDILCLKRSQFGQFVVKSPLESLIDNPGREGKDIATFWIESLQWTAKVKIFLLFNNKQFNYFII